MNEAKFQPGDIVRVINYPALRINARNYYKKTTEIIEGPITKTPIMGAPIYLYYLECDNSEYPWREDWLELIETKKQFDISETEIFNLVNEK